MSALGTLIRDRRNQRGLSLRALASAAGLSPMAISDIERGACNRPMQATLEALARVLDLDMADLAAAAYGLVPAQPEPEPAAS